MTSTTVYLHPRRTLAATWDFSGDVPCLIHYTELAPGMPLESLLAGNGETSLVVSSERWFVHAYPSPSLITDSERRRFELEDVCGMNGSQIVEVECALTLRSGLAWNTIIGLLPDGHHDALRGSSPTLTITSDIAADMRLALATTPAQPHHWALCGRRGSHCITVIITPDHVPVAVLLRDAAEESPFEQWITSELDSVRSRFGIDVQHVMLFGDFLTLPMIEQLRPVLRASGIKSTRLQPFRAVETSVDEATASRVLARAHVIAPIMNGILSRLTL